MPRALAPAAQFEQSECHWAVARGSTSNSLVWIAPVLGRREYGPSPAALGSLPFQVDRVPGALPRQVYLCGSVRAVGLLVPRLLMTDGIRGWHGAKEKEQKTLLLRISSIVVEPLESLRVQQVFDLYLEVKSTTPATSTIAFNRPLGSGRFQ